MKIRKLAGAVVVSSGLVLGMAGFAGATSGTIGLTGPQSNNQITANHLNTVNLHNNNNLNVSNPNVQSAITGAANSSFNTQGGVAQTGPAQNFNSANVSATVSNTGSAAALASWGAGLGAGDVASINTTGPLSNNQVLFNSTNTLNSTNNNCINVTNDNTQTALSGPANVSFNTLGGSAITGGASNSNTTSTSINVAN